MPQKDPQQLCVAFSLREIPKQLYPEIAFAGRSNVGKSSLINSLLDKRLAPISQTPGKTRSIRFYRFPLKGGKSLTLVDLPGYGWARLPEQVRTKWKDLVEGYLTGRSHLAAVVLVADLRRGSTELDREMVLWMRTQGVPYVVVATKADKVASGKRKPLLADLAIGAEISVNDVILFSAKSGEGKKEVVRVLSSLRKLDRDSLRHW